MSVIIVSALSDYTIGFLCAGTELIESVSAARLPRQLFQYVYDG
jgi:hypothetical protein